MVQDTQKNFPRIVTLSSNRLHRRRENSMDSNHGDEDDSYDVVTGANLTPLMVPEVLTGRPMQSRNKTPHQQCINDDKLDTILPEQQIPAHTNTQNTNSEYPADPIYRLADVIMGMNNKPSAQTLIVRLVSTTTLTFDGKCEEFELFEHLFDTMIRMQPDMTKTKKINYFQSLLRKNALQTFRKISSVNRQTLEDTLAIFRWKYVKPASQATVKHKRHMGSFDLNTVKLPDCLEELNQGAE